MHSSTSNQPSGRPLDGFLVVSLEQAVAAPYCSSRLADAGARVIKIERREGDFARGYDSLVKGESAYFVWLNRGKESICLDIKEDAEDRALFAALLRKADIYIQNLAPGAAERAGFGSRTWRDERPDLITVDISGYGQSGPYREMKAYDLLVQAESGLASINGSPEAPGRVGVSVCDIACGMYAYQAVLEAIIQRGRTGKGQTGAGRAIEVSLFDGMADWMTVPLLQHQYGGHTPGRQGLNHPTIAPYGIYPCGDGQSLLISIQNEREWKRLCADVMGNAAFATDPRFSDNSRRVANRSALGAEIVAAFARHPAETIAARLREAKIAYGYLNDLDGLMSHPQLRRRDVELPSGDSVALVAPPAQYPDEPERFDPVPALGQHTDAIRAEFMRKND